ncbi:unnamed protein product, partial [Mesorhabditis belari]|uniref:Glutathione peroxidase n=1 Tax=Mesorhabditis belari TaxID=2138241 RepID=A0AAF3JBH3_9BILA
MQLFSFFNSFLSLLIVLSVSGSEDEEEAMNAHKTIYEFVVKDADGNEVSMEKYRGQVLIVVNVASKCGFTHSNYKQLKQLSDNYYDMGLRVAAFPCNQFGGQEPGCELDVRMFVKDTYEYEPDLYAKINVNGQQADPLYTYLKKEQGGTLIDAIKWNFTKFLINRRGQVVKRYAPTTEPSKMEADIEKLLSESENL